MFKKGFMELLLMIMPVISNLQELKILDHSQEVPKILTKMVNSKEKVLSMFHRTAEKGQEEENIYHMVSKDSMNKVEELDIILMAVQ